VVAEVKGLLGDARWEARGRVCYSQAGDLRLACPAGCCLWCGVPVSVGVCAGLGGEGKGGGGDRGRLSELPPHPPPPHPPPLSPAPTPGSMSPVHPFSLSLLARSSLLAPPPRLAHPPTARRLPAGTPCGSCRPSPR
jgi:hypothetical protein